MANHYIFTYNYASNTRFQYSILRNLFYMEKISIYKYSVMTVKTIFREFLFSLISNDRRNVVNNISTDF